MAKKKTVRIIHWINMGIFPGTVMFSCGFSYDEMIALLKKKKAGKWLVAISDEPKEIRTHKFWAGARTLENTKTGEVRKYFYIVLTEPFLFNDESYVILAHEVLHICQFFLPDILDRNNEIEAEAYLHSHIMQECLDILRRKK